IVRRLLDIPFNQQ
ncbi:hypothetical protein EC960428_3248, partial [Escherichia coli 96.0428]